MKKYQNSFLKIFLFWVLKFSIYLNRRVFVMIRKEILLLSLNSSDCLNKDSEQKSGVLGSSLASESGSRGCAGGRGGAGAVFYTRPTVMSPDSGKCNSRNGVYASGYLNSLK